MSTSSGSSYSNSHGRKRLKRTTVVKCTLCHETHKSTLDNSIGIENLESSQSSPSLRKVFSCHQILKLILLPLLTSTLLNCRLVNLVFRDVATTILRDRKSLHLDFTFDSSELINSFILNQHHHCHKIELKSEAESTDSSQTNKNKMTLHDLNTLLISSTSTSFPCSSFSFSLSGTCLEDEAVQFFLDIFGYTIKRMKIRLPDSYSSLIAFRRLLKVQAPHLEFLDIEPIPNEWNSHPQYFLFTGIKQDEEDQDSDDDDYKNLIDSRNQLPNLKHLFMWPFNASNLILLEILKAAGNLQIFGRDETFFDLDVLALDHFISTAKTTTIKNIDFMPDFDAEEDDENLESLQNLEQFGDSEIHIKRIKIFLKNIWSVSQYFERVGKILSKILEKSKNSLEEIIIYQSIGFLGDSLKIPEFCNCQQLKICLFDEPSEEEIRNSPRYFPYNIFPLDFNVTQCFPNVQKLQLEFSEKAGQQNRDFLHEWNVYFPSALKIEMLSVKYLELDSLPLTIALNISNMIPNVQFLDIKKPIKNFNKGAKFIWQYFIKLQSLKFCIDVNSLDGNSIDSGITGFGIEQCKILQNNLTLKNYVSSSPENEEKSASILNLKDLREICLTFSDDSEVAKEFYSLMTNVSWEFGVKEMPGLSVKISVKSRHSENEERMKSSLDSIRPFISSVD